MRSREDRERFLAACVAAGIPREMRATPLHRLLWALGIDLKPPILMSSARLGIVQGSVFAVLWGAIMTVFVWGPNGTPAWIAGAGIVVAGVLFGAAMAFIHHRRRQSLTRRGLVVPGW